MWLVKRLSGNRFRRTRPDASRLQRSPRTTRSAGLIRQTWAKLSNRESDHLRLGLHVVRSHRCFGWGLVYVDDDLDEEIDATEGDVER